MNDSLNHSSSTPSQSPPASLNGVIGNAVVLLNDWEIFGIGERTSLHFDWMEALYDRFQPSTSAVIPDSPVLSISATSTMEIPMNTNTNKTPSSVKPCCGVVSLLECSPKDVRLRTDLRRKLRSIVRNFNKNARRVPFEDSGKAVYHAPTTLPLKISTSSTVAFAYETYRIAFLVDASPTLTTTFGFGNFDGLNSFCCPLDRLVPMVLTFFSSLNQPVSVQAPIFARSPSITTERQNVWRPNIAVTVMAVFPRGSSMESAPSSSYPYTGKTLLLVRDFRIVDDASVAVLIQKIEEWVMGPLECEIATRLAYTTHGGAPLENQVDCPGMDPAEDVDDVHYNRVGGNAMPQYTSHLRDLLLAGDAALSTLSSAARPLIVLATDARSLSIETTMIDIAVDPDRVDIPLIVLDLSSPESHGNGISQSALPEHPFLDNTYKHNKDFHLLSYDPIGAAFPLFLSDDIEALYAICSATNGCLFDAALLEEASQTFAGKVVNTESTFYTEFFFSNNRHTLHPNAVQWYTLFSVSPLTPIMNPLFGRLPPPKHICQKLRKGSGYEMGNTLFPDAFPSTRPPSSPDRKASRHSCDGLHVFGSPTELDIPSKKFQTQFSIYKVSPVHIKNFLLMRVKEGYRARQYGANTNDPDKMSIQFVLPLDLGCVLHYELLFKAFPHGTHLIGTANIKIDLAGEQQFVQSMKKEFELIRPVSPVKRSMNLTSLRLTSLQLCDFMRWTRSDDYIHSDLSPMRWSDHTMSPDTTFIARLTDVTRNQRRRHFRSYEFDCVCQGQLPFECNDRLFAEFCRVDGKQDLVEAVETWATRVVLSGELYLWYREGDRSSYCIVDITSSHVGPRLVRVSFESFGDIEILERLSVLNSLRQSISCLKVVNILEKQMSPFLVATDPLQSVSDSARFLEGQRKHSSWDLVKDIEILPLLVRRRIEIGNFFLLKLTENHVLLAKLSCRNKYEDERGNAGEDPGVLFQYQLSIKKDKAVIDLHMENEGGVFACSWASDQASTMFERMVRSLRTRDQDCAQALQSRTRLQRIFDSDVDDHEVYLSVLRLLEYASQSSVQLRFFRIGGGEANDILRCLTHETLLMNPVGVRVTRLPISPSFDSYSIEAADWFFVVFDDEIMSIARLSNVDKIEATDEGTILVRELTFFAFSTGDLYNRKNDFISGAGTGDEIEDEDITEYLCVSEFTDFVLRQHAKNYSAAAYKAFSLGDVQKLTKPIIHSQDFAFAMLPLVFVDMVSSVVDGRRHIDSSSSSYFSSVIGSILSTVSNDIDDCFYYRESDLGSIFNSSMDDSVSLSLFSDNASGGLEDNSYSDGLVDGDASKPGRVEIPNAIDDESESQQMLHQHLSGVVPIFVKVHFDGSPVSFRDIKSLKSKVSVSFLFSVFSDEATHENVPRQLPSTHTLASAEVSGRVNEYVAEQTLERLLDNGPGILTKDLQIAKSCVRMTRNVVNSSIDLFFYATRADAMVLASAPASCNADVELCFHMLKTRISKCRDVTFRSFEEGFVAIDTEPESNRLAHWTFLSLKRSQGYITVEVYHPGGLEAASGVLSVVHFMLSTSCHEVNQELLLQSLHQKRLASSLLIPCDGEETKINICPHADDDPFTTGLFGCRIVFQHRFDLFHRCATNPSQVARTVENTALHVFSITNRDHVFVYKDEDGSVFYMKLVTEGGGGIDPDGTIELVVHGICSPGPSVTTQLTAIIQKRLMQIGVDSLSSILTKNPSYTWRHPDIIFIRAYEDRWQELDGNCTQVWTKDRFYEFPNEDLFDPGMILLCLRQNLCGSTYFHKLNQGDLKCGVAPDDGSIILADFGLLFYYNNAPSKLDPKFQRISTLTSKGAEYARDAGSGMAIIELELVAAAGTPFDRLQFGRNEMGSPLSILDPESIRFKIADQSMSSNCQCQIKVRITGTALDSDVLHSWLLLCLNQTLLSWAIERHLESIQLGTYTEPVSDVTTENDSEKAIRTEIGRLSPGLLSFTSLLKTSYSTPHPSVLTLKLEGVVRSSHVATLALGLIEKVVENARSGLSVIRISRNEAPRKVDLRWDAGGRSAVAYDLSSSSSTEGISITDSPISCPEYLCFFFTPEYASSGTKIDAGPPKLFEVVTLTDGTGEEPIPALVEVQRRKPSLFVRSVAFVFSIKRNRRLLYTYNLTPQQFKQSDARLRETNTSALESTNFSSNSLQLRSLQALSPKPTSVTVTRKVAKPNLPRESRDIGVRSTQDRTSNDTDSGLPTPKAVALSDHPGVLGKRAIRPVSIRKPKLIGKSVEGAAVHAVAASRARASTNMIRGSGAGSATISHRQPTKDYIDHASPRHETPPARDKQIFSSVPEPSNDAHYEHATLNYREASSDVANSLRLHSLQKKAMLSMCSVLVHQTTKTKRDASAIISTTLASFLLSRSSIAWSDVTELISLPSDISVSLLRNFSFALTFYLPAIKMLPSVKNAMEGDNNNSPLLLMGEIKSTRNCKCVPIFSVEIVRRPKRSFVRCSCWLIIQPRHSTKLPVEASMKLHAQPLKQSDLNLFERDAAGLDLQASETRRCMTIRRLLFDFLASVSEYGAKAKADVLDSLAVARGIISNCNLVFQTRVLKCNYNIFESQLVLPSYRDRLINSFSASELLHWLISNANSQGVTPCGTHGLFLQKPLLCRDVNVSIFLRNDSPASDRFVLLLLCRTGGTNIREYMFPQDTIFAVSTMDYIAITAAGRVYDLLQTAASSLHLEHLWDQVTNRRKSTVKDEVISELLRMSVKKPLVDLLSDSLDVLNVSRILDGGLEIDWARCMEIMAKDPALMPCWPIDSDASRQSNIRSNLYYIRADDVFLHVTFSPAHGSNALQVSIIFKSELDTVSAKSQENGLQRSNIAQKLANYFLHFIWSDLL